MPFQALSFAFFDVAYSDVFVNSNGYLSFGAGSTIRASAPIPDPAPPNNFIAAWWSDLDPSAGGSIIVDEFVDRRVVTFDNVDHFSPGSPSTFQIKLFADSTIELHYAFVNSDGSFHTIGVENGDGTIGVGVFRGTGGLAANSAIRFSPVPLLSSWTLAALLAALWLLAAYLLRTSAGDTPLDATAVHAGTRA